MNLRVRKYSRGIWGRAEILVPRSSVVCFRVFFLEQFQSNSFTEIVLDLQNCISLA